jgi:hypothetical protein
MLKILPRPDLVLFQSVKLEWHEENTVGIIIGITWEEEKIDQHKPFEFSQGEFEYDILLKNSETQKLDFIHQQDSKGIILLKEDLFPEIPRPEASPAYQVGDCIGDDESYLIVISCQWGALGYADEFLPGWNYLTYWSVSQPEDDFDFFWDSNGIMSESELSNSQKMALLPQEAK